MQPGRRTRLIPTPLSVAPLPRCWECPNPGGQAGEDKTLVAEAIVGSWSMYQPETAAAMYWAESVTGQKQRYQLMSQVGLSWVKTDPNAARYYIAHSDLPAKLKKRFLQY